MRTNKAKNISTRFPTSKRKKTEILTIPAEKIIPCLNDLAAFTSKSTSIANQKIEGQFQTLLKVALNLIQPQAIWSRLDYDDIAPFLEIIAIQPGIGYLPKQVHFPAAKWIGVICTIGKELESICSEYYIQGHHLNGYLLDLIGTLAISKTVTHIIETLRAGSGAVKFRPGSPGLPMSFQSKLFNILPAEVIKVTLTTSLFMLPLKSCSFVIAASNAIPQEICITPCAWCRRKTEGTCSFANEIHN
ncbi:MAG TPA: hypothetical protein G4N92_09705 [Anaerolineae bacterium]|nr:hypothetical protein [Anaerolineae bacterium]